MPCEVIGTLMEKPTIPGPKAEGSTGETSGVPIVVPLGTLPNSFALSGPDARAVMQGEYFGLLPMASSAAAFLADGNTVTLSATSSVPSAFWNSGLLTDGGFSVISDLATPMQWASCVSPRVSSLVLGFLVDFQPAGMSARTRRSFRAWVGDVARLDAAPASLAKD